MLYPKLLIISFLIYLPYIGSGQVISANIGMGWGLNSLSSNARSRIGTSASIGASMRMNEKSGSIYFEPSIGLTRSSYRTLLDERTIFISRSRSILLDMVAGSSISDHSRVYVGIFGGVIFAIRGEVQWRHGHMVNGYAEEEISSIDVARTMKAGIILGAGHSFPSSRFAIDLRARIHVVPLTGNDVFADIGSNKFLVISGSARPVELLLYVNFELSRSKR